LPVWLQWTTTGVVLIFMLAGLVGSVVPLFPGPFVMWLAALGYGIATRAFSPPGILFFVLISLLALSATFVDNLLMGVGARKGGAAWLTIGVALFAGVAGTIVLPPFGGIIAAPLAILLLEYMRIKDWRQAAKALTGLTVGWGLSFAARFAIGLIIFLLWGMWVFKG
jgi:uncharacterized protein